MAEEFFESDPQSLGVTIIFRNDCGVVPMS